MKTDRNYKDLADKMYLYFEDNGHMPTFETLRRIFKVSSKDTVSKIVDKLVDLNLVNKNEMGKLIALKKKTKKQSPILKMLHTVEAGFPTFVDISDTETISLDDWIIGDRSATFMLKVKGESMIDAGIFDGDYVIVERGKEPRIGDIVLAAVDGGWTLKFFQKDKDGMYLQAANKDFKIIRPKENLEIPAVLISVIRKYI